MKLCVGRRESRPARVPRSTLWVQLAEGNAETWIVMECHGDRFCVIVVHAVENLHMFKGPDDFNGYGYFHVCLYCTGLGFQANIVEEYVLLSALLHIFARLNSRSEVVFWIEEWSIEFGYHWLDVAHVHDHSPLSAPLCRY